MAVHYWTVSEVAAYFRTTPAVVRYWRFAGTGPRGVRVGTRVLYPVAAVEAYDRQLLTTEADRFTRRRV